MSSGPPNLDPRLGGSVDSKPVAPSPLPPIQYDRSLPPASQLMPPGGGTPSHPYQQAASPAQPYYQYPTPHAHTPQQPSTGAPSVGSQSNQASPVGAGAGYPGQPDGGDHSPNEDEGGAGEDAKRPRACEACRGLKVRCDQDPSHPDLPCRRCQKAGRQCIITAPSRKRQKKADNRVAELEKKLDALTAVLQQQQAGHAQYGSPYSGGAPPADMTHGRPGSLQQSLHQYQQLTPASGSPAARPESSGMQPPQKRRRTEDGPRETESLDAADVSNPGPASRYGSSSSQGHETYRQMNDAWGPQGADSLRHLVHRSPEEFMNRIASLVSPDMGAGMFNRYLTKLSPHMPAVVFPPDTTAEQVRKEKPILYACILSATSAGLIPPDISQQLSREAIRAIADCVVCNGAKSLELIQAMQVLALWYKPPERADQTNFYQIIHMAAVMAIDIGLGKRFNATKARRGFGGPNADMAPGPHMMLPQNSDTIEARRAWLGCYYLCAR